MIQRKKVIPHASGTVLEIGIGSGLNLPFYDIAKVSHVTGIDPSREIWNKKMIDIDKLPFSFEFIEGYAEDIPADNKYFDSIVITYTICTIPELPIAFEEIRRVLKPNGMLLFCEHGIAPDKSVQRIQNMINPLWKKAGGGCHLNRNIPLLIEKNGFKMNACESMYIPGWKPASFNYWGQASPM
jgi:ubiquinone/menaquinone biosynthesis C-methylase UbiE